MATIGRLASRPGWGWREHAGRFAAWLKVWIELWNEAQENARKAQARYPFSE
jgi:hypothetical protein